MTFEDCVKIGRECNLEIVGEAVYNVEMRAGQMYSEIEREMMELREEIKEMEEKYGVKEDSGLDFAYHMVLKKKYTVDVPVGVYAEAYAKVLYGGVSSVVIATILDGEVGFLSKKNRETGESSVEEYLVEEIEDILDEEYRNNTEWVKYDSGVKR